MPACQQKGVASLARNKKQYKELERGRLVDVLPVIDEYERKLTTEQVRDRFKPAVTATNKDKGDYIAQDATLQDSGVYDLLSSGLLGCECSMPYFLGYGQLAALSQDGLIRAGVSAIADEMTRQWIELQRSGEGDDEDDEILGALYAEMEEFDLQEVFHAAKETDGYFGGALVYIDTGEVDPEKLRTPFYPAAAVFEQGSFKGFRLIEPYNVSPANYNATSPWRADYFKPRCWNVNGIEIHETRFLYFASNPVPTLLKPSYNFFGIPTTQIVYNVVKNFMQCREAAARLLKKFSLTVLKTDMQQILTSGGASELDRRLQLFVQNRDNDGLLVIQNGDPDGGGGEDILKLETPLSGVTDIVRQAMEMVAAYFNEPVIKIWGLTPGGLNSTGESDMANHYDHIATLQERVFREPLKKALDILQVNKFGSIDKSINFVFCPLSAEDSKLVAEVQKVKAETDSVLVTAGALAPEEVRGRLASDPDSGYNGIDIDAVPEGDMDNPEGQDKYGEGFEETKDPEENAEPAPDITE